MSKIWLTWLQPSLGVLGTVLVLANPLCSIAAPIAKLTARVTQKPAQPAYWNSAKSDGTSMDRDLLKGVAASPDAAIRKLAMDAIATSGVQPNITVGRVPQNFNPLASFTGTPARFNQLSAKANKSPQIKQSLTAALSQTNTPKSQVLVPGLAIGTSNVQVASGGLPKLKLATPVATMPKPKAVAPVQLAAVIPATTVATPFPVVRPELMQKLEAAPVVASSVPDIKTASRNLQGLGIVSPGLPKAVGNISINPIASIPNGLQQLLGNNLDGGTKVVNVPVAKATGPNFRSMAALNTLVSPAEIIAPATVTTASLRLATAQGYTSAVKFSIPGETVVTAKQVQQNVTVATSTSQRTNFVALIGTKVLTPAIGAWTAVGHSSNLGGLILGSQQLATLPKVVSLVPLDTVKSTASTGINVRNLGNVN